MGLSVPAGKQPAKEPSLSPAPPPPPPSSGVVSRKDKRGERGSQQHQAASCSLPGLRWRGRVLGEHKTGAV